MVNSSKESNTDKVSSQTRMDKLTEVCGKTVEEQIGLVVMLQYLTLIYQLPTNPYNNPLY